jgi:protein SCO1/2
MMGLPALVISLLLFVLSAGGALAHGEKHVAASTAVEVFDNDKALEISQLAIDNLVGDHDFVNSSGESVSLQDFRGKPLVLSMIYTSCYHICPMTIQHLSKVVEKARKALGKDSFSVAVVGFDSRFDTPEAMKDYGFKQGIDVGGWSLLSIDHENVDALAKDVGFTYYPSSNGFDHVIQATIIDADGKVYRQVYGQLFDTPLLVDPLIELVLGHTRPAQSFLSNMGDKIKLFCTTYDPVTDGYYFDYSLFLGMLIGATIILFTGIVVIREIRKGQISA